MNGILRSDRATRCLPSSGKVAIINRMSTTEITLTVTVAEEGGFVASWDDPRGGGITTQGEDLRELQEMVRDAVEGYFRAASAQPPRNVRLHFVEDPALVIA
jgi:predicted RNase H-like HicB family nuclease